ncbi:molybdenum cofactor guanylyltransferase [Tsuneonella sp. SYSU-LHT278]|uniref:molybdenum cofactor guanylyltransferase n=1 Tax=Tsuneonella sediminis TaxID=3416089 RepID=UPI003F7A5615
MHILGAVIAGGRSRRFGSDKALHLHEGVPLLEHAAVALSRQTHTVAICGRDVPGYLSLPDLPRPGLGPLGGLNAALHHAAEHGFDAVLSVPVDTVPLPDRLPEILGNPPAALEGQFLVGLWPASFASLLDEHLAQGRRAVKSWIEACGCRLVDDRALGLSNLNSAPEDTRRSLT